MANRESCTVIYNEIRNAELGLKSSLKYMNEFDQEAKRIRKEVEDLEFELAEVLRDISIGLAGDAIKRSVPLSVLSASEGALRIGRIRKNIRDKTRQLSDKIRAQNNQFRHVEDKERELQALRQKKDKAGC